MSPIQLSIQQPITVTVGVILCIMAGLLALERVPIQLAPEVEDTVIAVTTRWENASPQEIEQEIIEEQEERLQGLANLRTMTSTSTLGQGEIRLEFHQGVNKDTALREVSDKLREVPDYPENVDEPVVEASDPSSRDFIAWVIFFSEDPTVDVRTLRDFLDKRVKPQLERVPGISEVQIRGGMEREAQIRFDPVLLAQRGISYTQLIRALRATNQNASAGALADGKSDVRVRMQGRFGTPEQIENTVVRQDEGGPIYVRDIASVAVTHKEPDAFVRANGRPVIAMNFQREIGSNVIQVMTGLKRELAQINEPGGVLDSHAKAQGHSGPIKLVQVSDNTSYIHDAIELVRGNIWIGSALAIVVLLLFLRSLRSVGIIALAIPISVVGTIVAMVALGRSINVISLAGMAFAVGMVVDNAIVVLENIYRHLEMGKDARRAAFDGATEVAGAVVASTLTTVVVFIPILLIQESAGQLFRDIALAICAAVSLSLLVSLTVIPSATALLLRGRKSTTRKTPDEQHTSWIRRLFDPPRLVSGFVNWVLGSTLLRLLIVVIFVAVSVVGSYVLMPPIDYLPSGNRNLVFGIMIFPPGYNLGQIDRICKRIEKRMSPFWGAGPGIYGYDGNKTDPSALPKVPVFMGPGQPPLMVQPPPLSRYFFVGRTGMAFHGAISQEPERVIDLPPLFQYATDSEVVPGTLAFARQFPIFRVGGGDGASIEIDLTGPDLDKVVDTAGALYGRLVQAYGPWSVQPSPSNFNIPGPELRVVPDLIHLTDVRMSVTELGLAVAANGDGAFVGQYQVGDELIDLKLISKDSVGQTSLAGLEDVPLATGSDLPLPVSTDSGFAQESMNIVTLGSIAKIIRTNAPQEIKRVGRQRAVTLQFRPPTGMPLEAAVGALKETVAEMKAAGQIPLGVEASLAGSASKLSAMRIALLGDGTLKGTLTSSLFLALLVVYLMMCVLFQSFVHPFVIMFSVPLATFGGFLALSGVHHYSLANRYMTVQNLDVLTILGFVILAGVVVNNAILIVHQTRNFMAGTSGEGGRYTPREAIVQAVQTRVRPILMSTLTSVGGMLPLVLMPGSGSELYRGLGSVVVGGLIVSTIFTLLLVPVLLSLMFGLQQLLGKKPQAIAGVGSEQALSA